MITNKTLALITARGGSKCLPRKNLLIGGGKPLIAWSIEAALKSNTVNRVILSSDDDEIIATALNWGCEVPFKRPAHLASDISTSMDVVMHALDELPGYDYIVLLQPTSPLRTAEDIDNALRLIKYMNAPCCVSVCESDQSPYWMYQLTNNGKLNEFLNKPLEFTRRQDLPTAYVLNGAIYVAQVDWLRNTKNFLADGCIAYIMPKLRSIDIDTAEDFEKFRSIVE